MAESVRRRDTRGVPLYDPTAVGRRYAAHRARRQARVQRVRDRRFAGLRFFVVMLILLGACAYLALALRHEIGRLFGL